MSALHRAWLADEADAIKYQREMRELDTYANPNPANKAAAQKVRGTWENCHGVPADAIERMRRRWESIDV